MNKHFTKTAIHIFAEFNVHATRLTDKNKLKLLLNSLQPINCDKELIRFGPVGDGGYLIPNDLLGIEACFSPGVGSVFEFEKECVDMGIKVFLADNSVENPDESNNLFHFTKKHIGVTTNDNCMTLDNWVSTLLPESQGDLLLQMDIEGYEYEVLLGVSDNLLKRFRIIVVEFHTLTELWNKPFFNLLSRVFEKLLQTHTCVHNHPNNWDDSLKIGEIEIPKTIELTFLRNDRVSGASPAKTFPHQLDSDNTKDLPPLHLPKCWYNGK